MHPQFGLLTGAGWRSAGDRTGFGEGESGGSPSFRVGQFDQAETDVPQDRGQFHHFRQGERHSSGRERICIKRHSIKIGLKTRAALRTHQFRYKTRSRQASPKGDWKANKKHREQGLFAGFPASSGRLLWPGVERGKSPMTRITRLVFLLWYEPTTAEGRMV